MPNSQRITADLHGMTHFHPNMSTFSVYVSLHITIAVNGRDSHKEDSSYFSTSDGDGSAESEPSRLRGDDFSRSRKQKVDFPTWTVHLIEFTINYEWNLVPHIENYISHVSIHTGQHEVTTTPKRATLKGMDRTLLICAIMIYVQVST